MVIVATSLVLGMLGSLGLLDVTNSFLSFLPNDGFVVRFAAMCLSLLPLTAFIATYQRHSRYPFRWWEPISTDSTATATVSAARTAELV